MNFFIGVRNVILFYICCWLLWTNFVAADDKELKPAYQFHTVKRAFESDSEHVAERTLP